MIANKFKMTHMKTKTKIYYLNISLFMALMFTSGCYYDQVLPVEGEAPETVSFAADVEPIFSNGTKCTACHPPTRGLDLTQGNAYSSINDGRVDLSNPNQSLIYTKPEPGGSHPNTYSVDEAAIVLKWIEDGALDN